MADHVERPPAERPKAKRSRREITRMVVTVAALLLLIAFVLDNSRTVTVGFVFFNSHMSLIWALLIAAVLGALVDRLAIVLSQRRKRSANKRSANQ